MTIDERLERLTERHEALAQSVELIANLQQRNEESIGALAVTLEKNQILMAQMLESINSLARIAHSHEQRLSDLENGRKPN